MNTHPIKSGRTVSWAYDSGSRKAHAYLKDQAVCGIGERPLGHKRWKGHQVCDECIRIVNRRSHDAPV